jgi:hypothetical protein
VISRIQRELEQVFGLFFVGRRFGKLVESVRLNSFEKLGLIRSI